MSLYLYLKGGSRLELSKSCPDLKKEFGYDFTKAEVVAGTWILYTYPDFNDAQMGAHPENALILEDKDGERPITTLNGSAFLLSDSVEGVTLFEHNNYGGTSKWIEDRDADLTDVFPKGSRGVSAAIVQSKSQTFLVFDRPHYQGIRADLKPGTRYPNSNAMGFPNDKVQSIRRN